MRPATPVSVRYAVGDVDAAARRERGRTLLRQLVGELAGLESHRVIISASCPDCGRHDHGRPLASLPDGAPPVWVSLSHSGGVTVAAASLLAPVGIDAESTGTPPIRRTDAARLLGATAGADPLTAWTRVEAVLKADGRGLRVDPAAVGVHEVAGIPIARIDGDARYGLDTVELRDDLVVSVAWRLP